MYFYSREQLEEIASSINKKYYPERLKKLSRLDPYELAEKMGLEYEWKYITPDSSILGMLFFDDGDWPVWDRGTYKKGDVPHFEKFKKATIVINNILLEKKINAKKETFVVTHECCHWIKDQEYFKDHINDIVQICRNDDFEKTYWNNNSSTLERIERQNNYLTAALLMPKEAVKDFFFKSIRWTFVPNQPVEYEEYMKAGISKIAKELNINFNPVLYRLYDLNILKRR